MAALSRLKTYAITSARRTEMIVINVPLSKGLIIHRHIYRSKVEEVFPNWYIADVASYLGEE